MHFSITWWAVSLRLQLARVCQIIPNDFIQFYLHFHLALIPLTLTSVQAREESSKRLKYVRTNTKRTICFKLSVATGRSLIPWRLEAMLSLDICNYKARETQNANAKWTLLQLTDPVGYQQKLRQVSECGRGERQKRPIWNSRARCRWFG